LTPSSLSGWRVFCFWSKLSGGGALGVIEQEGVMAPKAKRRSVMDTLRDLLEKLNELGPLLKPKSLQPIPIPVRDADRRRR
jgi:hypothetical protein